MQKVQNGLFVSVEYKGTLSSGEVFDTSRNNHPLEVEMGSGRLIKGFEEALMGMSLNERKTFTVEPKDAYGERDESLKKSFPKREVPPGVEPQVGQTVTLSSPQGQEIPGWISDVDDEKITIDLNHPLAGQSLTFEVEVVGIENEPKSARQGCREGCDCASGCA